MNKEEKPRNQDTPPDFIWHFTRIETLPKILAATGGGLLSSHVRFLGDPADGSIGRPIAEEAGEILCLLLKQTEEMNQDDAVMRMRELSNLGIKLSMFVTCFCKNIDRSPLSHNTDSRAGYDGGTAHRRNRRG